MEHLWSALRVAAAQGDGSRGRLRDLGLVLACTDTLRSRPADEEHLVGNFDNQNNSRIGHYEFMSLSSTFSESVLLQLSIMQTELLMLLHLFL